jgi:protein SCO1
MKTNHVRIVFALLVLLTIFPLKLTAQGPGSYFQGLSLVDQNGRRVALYEDVVKGHVVLIHSFFSHCQGVCPVMTGNLLALQKRFADASGGRLRIVSISVDPVRDTPRVLRDYAKKIKAGDGWMFLTGTQTEVDAVLSKLGQFADSPESHSNIMIVGNEPTGLWKKVLGLANAEAVGDVVQSVLDDGVTLR